MEISEFDLHVQQIVAIAGICIWFVFPIGMFISIIGQDREAMPAPKAPTHYLEDPFAGVKLGTEKEFEEPMMEDFGHHHINIAPGPNNEHVSV